MEDILIAAAIGVAALVASTMSAVAGFGGAAIMLPVLVWAFRIGDAVPILTIAQLMSNLSRVWFNRTELSFPVVRWFALGAVPAAMAGGIIFATAPAGALVRLLGIFLLLMVAYRHTPWARKTRIGLRGFLPLVCNLRGYLCPGWSGRAVHGPLFPRLRLGKRCVYRNRSFGYGDDARHKVGGVRQLPTDRRKGWASRDCHRLCDVRGIIPGQTDTEPPAGGSISDIH